MSSYVITCPYCHTTKTVSPNTQYICRGCGARISVGNDGEIRNSKSGKK